MKRHSLIVVVGLSLALGFVVRELSVQVTLAQGRDAAKAVAVSGWV